MTQAPSKPMRALTIWQPFCSLILIGAKPYEFRPWPAPAWIVGERIVLHAGKRKPHAQEIADIFDPLSIGQIPSCMTGAKADKHIAAALDLLEPFWLRGRKEALPLAAGLGTVKVGESKRAIDLFAGEIDPDDINPDIWAWPMLDPRAFERPVPMSGNRKLWSWPSPAEVS